MVNIRQSYSPSPDTDDTDHNPLHRYRNDPGATDGTMRRYQGLDCGQSANLATRGLDLDRDTHHINSLLIYALRVERDSLCTNQGLDCDQPLTRAAVPRETAQCDGMLHTKSWFEYASLVEHGNLYKHRTLGYGPQ